MVERMVWGFLIYFFIFFVSFFFLCGFFSMRCKYTGSDMNVAKLIEEGLSFNVI